MKPAEPDALRRAAALLEEYMQLGTPTQIRKQLEQQKQAIDRLNRRLDAVQAKVREKGWQP